MNSRPRPSIQFGPPPDKPSATTMRGKRVFLVVLAAVFAATFGLGAMGCFLLRMSATLPGVDQLQNIQPALVSRVMGIDGSLVHEFSTEKRIWVSLDSIPANLIMAVVATEDRKFYQHWGIDVKRIIGAAFANVLRRGIAQGGSTITQQLARNVYLTARQSMIRKVREALTAVQIEKFYSKREILELYLNQVYLGAGVYGVEAASHRYFSKSVSQLDLNECAMLAGTIQLPEYYRPDKPANEARARNRRNAVLAGMVKTGFADRATTKTTKALPVPSNPEAPSPPRAPYFMEAVRKYIEQKYGEDLLYNGGLTIYTTLDPVAQDSAEQAMTRHLPSLQRRLNRMFVDSSEALKITGIRRDTFLTHFDSLYALYREKFKDFPDSVKRRIAQSAVVALDVKSGGVLALIGGRNFTESKFNRAMQSVRQPGSAMKPIVYTAGFDNGYTPASEVLDQPITLKLPEGEWRPENYDKDFLGPITIRRALYKSVNLVAIQVLMQVGAQTVVDYARRMGLSHQLNPVPSLAIGSCEVTPLELTSAYSVYPNYGSRIEPYLIRKIVDKNGRTLESHVPVVQENILSPATAFLMCDVMSDVVRRGTAAKIPGMGFTRPSAGKTGTTNDYSDAWFVGFTPQVVCGVWVGVDERRSLGRGVHGADAALPIYVPAMKALHRSRPVAYFRKPEGVVTGTICKESHLLATRFCPDKMSEYFKEEVMPDTCDRHGSGRARKGDDIMDFFGTSKQRERKDTKKKERKLTF